MAPIAGFLLVFASLVALVQGVAWLGPRRGPPRVLRGAALGVLGVLGLGVGLVLALVPGFFG